RCSEAPAEPHVMSRRRPSWNGGEHKSVSVLCERRNDVDVDIDGAGSGAGAAAGVVGKANATGRNCGPQAG
ncbi:hypothetical protein, partial [Streptomyces sp. NPDC059641]|uniref:hypothetical protein n=2 Tax=unclassified Streptomyces TaxID=2593676 RepID=UPI0036BFA676